MFNKKASADSLNLLIKLNTGDVRAGFKKKTERIIICEWRRRRKVATLLKRI